jgi:sulfatase maturation enzyme AslB (radical SAM superfamily)
MNVGIGEDGLNACPEVEFLWLELTNRCNLQCVHCYAESGPNAHSADRLQRGDYERLIDDARELGCRQVQFIGGEPTLNHDLPRFIHSSRQAGYTSVEVFTNLTYLPQALLESFREHDVSVATSFYSARREVHERITKVRGSFDRTVRNIGRVLAAELPLRAGIIEMEENCGQTQATIDYLQTLGVERVGVDRMRKFGRAEGNDELSAMSELCGNCASRTLCVGPDGAVSPCIMASRWAVGSVLDQSLAELARSTGLKDLRAAIYQECVVPREGRTAAVDDKRLEGSFIGHAGQCQPCIPYCAPGQQCFPCNPNGGQPCEPNGRPCAPV